MTNIEDIVKAVSLQFRACVPEASHYVGYLPERHTTPSFLYLMVFNGDTRSSYYRKDVVVDLQIIYLGLLDEFGKPLYRDEMRTMNKLKQFLSGFIVSVGDRRLGFEYTFGEADEQLTINIRFRFKDDLINLEYEESQNAELIETITVNKERVK